MADMRLREIFIVMFLIGFALCGSSAVAQAEGKFKLKPGATGDLCLSCHTGFSDKMKAKHIHTPLAEGECTGCHNPHTSNHDMLMDGDADSICYNCHDNVVPEDAGSAHQVVAEGQCVSCHDPHSSDNPANLVKGGSDLCFDCHKELGEKIATNKYEHIPVKKDCLGCHNPHASEKNLSLLKAEEPGLCLGCHKVDSSGFKKRHMNYPVEQGRCTSCHDPHGSNSGAILADNVHEPINNQMCNQCHNEPNSAQPFAVKKTSFELCQGCHYEMINESFSKNRLHWPVVDNTGCINCHTPHASSEAGLLRESMLERLWQLSCGYDRPAGSVPRPSISRSAKGNVQSVTRHMRRINFSCKQKQRQLPVVPSATIGRPTQPTRSVPMSLIREIPISLWTVSAVTEPMARNTSSFCITRTSSLFVFNAIPSIGDKSCANYLFR